jgi:DNA polymerase III delta prime subunit
MDIPFLKKYQPRCYKDFIIDDNYIQLLNTLLKMDNLNILLIGNSGCGKTSLIEATIREYYKTEKIPSDNVLIINNLKEQGIQYYRTEVKTFCQTRSNIPNKKKIIMLDDIDLINDQSQQVFRNCIDKYSHNVQFISSCSNIQKVIDSIQSRCCIIKIKPLKKQYLKKIYNKIRKNENIQITKNAEEFILNICNNSTRQLINYLEKFKLLNIKIDNKKVKEICTNISYYEFERYTEFWFKQKNLKKAVKIIYNIFDKGYSVMDILDSYFIFIKFTDLLKENDKFLIIKVICRYISIFHNVHESEIELTFFTNDLIKLKNNNILCDA